MDGAKVIPARVARRGWPLNLFGKLLNICQ